MVNRPASFDTLVVANLHADILSDLAAALAGSLGIAPTGNIDPERRYPSMFEPIHGSAFDISVHRRSHPGRLRSPRHQRRAPGRLTGVASRRDRLTRQGLVSPRHYAFGFKRNSHASAVGPPIASEEAGETSWFAAISENSMSRS